MKTGTLFNSTRGKMVAHRVRQCKGYFDRMKGLLGTKDLSPEEACWLIPCNSVHTFGMQYAIDVYFLNKDNRVLSKMEDLQPNRLTPLIWRAHSVLEMKAGSRRDLLPGDQLSWDETP